MVCYQLPGIIVRRTQIQIAPQRHQLPLPLPQHEACLGRFVAGQRILQHPRRNWDAPESLS